MPEINEQIISAATPAEAEAVLAELKKQIGEEAALKAMNAFLQAGITKPKPGIMTTEMWLIVAANAGTVASAAAGFIPAPWGAIAAAAVGAVSATIYAILRTQVKTAASAAAASPEVAKLAEAIQAAKTFKAK